MFSYCRNKEKKNPLNILERNLFEEMTEILPVVDDAPPLSFWGWLIMVWSDIIFNFDFEKDWPTVAVFFATLCVALVVFFEVAKSLGLCGALCVPFLFLDLKVFH